MSATAISRDEVYQAARKTLDMAAYAELLEAITAAIFTKTIGDGDVVVDCGANVGRHTIAMARLVGQNGKVHSFEVSPEVSPVVLPWLKERVAAAGVSDRVVLHEVAVARAAGSVTFHFTQGGAYGMSALQPRRLTEELKKTVRYVPTTVRAVRLDDEISDLSRLTFMKLDLEGGEFDALVGAKRILARNRPVVVFENGRSESAEDYRYSKEDFFGFFASISYRLYDVFGYPFEAMDWQRGGVPWQCVGLPSEAPLAQQFMHDIQREQRKAGLIVS